MPPADRQSVLERHAQTTISLVITALLMWVGASVSELREAVARQDERLVAMQGAVGTINSLRGEMTTLRDRVTALEVKSGRQK